MKCNEDEKRSKSKQQGDVGKTFGDGKPFIALQNVDLPMI